MEGAFLFTLIVASLAVGFFLFSEKGATTMSGKIQKSYTTQDPVLVMLKKLNKIQELQNQF